MKGFFRVSLLFALITTPLFAARTHRVSIPEAVTVGSTKIPAGDYKFSWEGDGADVKVTLTKSGTPPIVLNAKQVTEKNFVNDTGIVTSDRNGSTTLVEIQMKTTGFVFGDVETAQK